MDDRDASVDDWGLDELFFILTYLSYMCVMYMYCVCVCIGTLCMCRCRDLWLTLVTSVH